MRYKVFGKQTGLRVSELVLGTGNFGTGWGYGTEPDESRRILDAFLEAGGNFIDTANAYQNGQSEQILGDALLGRRDDVVLATKYAMPIQPGAGLLNTGNSRKAMAVSVEQSLKRLKTDYIDMLWIHFTDEVTPAEEIVRGFDDLVRAGKIIYAGLSNFPAWRVSRAATIAELRGAAPIAGIQFEYSLVERSGEAELVPAGEALGLGMVAWSPQGGGVLTGKYRRGEKGRLQGFGGAVFQAENSPQRTAVIDDVITIAKEIGAEPGQVAVAWVASKGALPLIGPRTLDQLKGNLATLDVKLSAEHLARLDKVSALPLTFPYSAIKGAQGGLTAGMAAQLDRSTDTVA
jgi:aryl-alcohol dehydrogenase-like predicted oxidoreductase